MATKHTAAFIEQILVKVLSRGDRTIQLVADELKSKQIDDQGRDEKAKKYGNTGRTWQRETRRDWTATEQLLAVQETHELSGEALHAWCPEGGLFAHHLSRWHAAFCASRAVSDPNNRALRTLQDENNQLKRELVGKEKP